MVNYLRFARYGRGQRLRGIDASFEELKDSRYDVDSIVSLLVSLQLTAPGMYLIIQLHKGEYK